MPNPVPAAAPGLPAIPDAPLGRLAFVAEALGVPAPEGLLADLLDADGAPAQPVLAFCAAHGASLDFIYPGDVAILVRYPAKAVKAFADTPVMRLFREWKAKFDWIESDGLDLSDAEMMPHYRENDEQGDRIMALPCETPRDFAAKLLVATRDGNHDLADLQAGLDLMAEARALVG